MSDAKAKIERLYDYAISYRTLEGIRALRDEALRLADDIRDLKAQRDTAEGVSESAEKALESMLQENKRLAAEVERLKAQTQNITRDWRNGHLIDCRCSQSAREGQRGCVDLGCPEGRRLEMKMRLDD